MRRESDVLTEKCLRCAHYSCKAPGYCGEHRAWIWHVYASCSSWLDGRRFSPGQLSLLAQQEAR